MSLHICEELCYQCDLFYVDRIGINTHTIPEHKMLCENFVRIELGNQYPLLGKYTVYFHIENDKVNDIRSILEGYYGATDIRS